MVFRFCTAMLLAAAVLSGSRARAQDGGPTLAGIRQGTSLWLTKNGTGPGSLKFPPQQTFTWNKEIFYRTGSFGKWAGEGGLQHYGRREEKGEDGSTRYRIKTDFLQINATLQYDVSYPVLGYIVPLFLKMRSYAGITFSPRLGFFRKTPMDAAAGEPARFTDASMMIGVSYSHILPVGGRWWVTSVFSYRSVPFNRFREDKTDFGNPNRAFSWSGGMGYRL